MQEPIAITLRPERVTVAAGGAAAQVVAVIKNQTPVVDSYRLEIADLNPDWYDLPTRDLTLFPGEQKTLSLSFHPTPDFSTLAGRYDYRLRVRSTIENNPPQEAAGVLLVTLPEAINLRLKRDISRGQEGKFELTVTNRTKSAQLVTFLAEQEEENLDFNFEPSSMEIAPGRSQIVDLTTSPHPGQVLTEARAFAFTLSAQTVDEREKSNQVEGQFLFTPAQIRMELLPSRLKGSRGQFNLNVANPGLDPTAIELSATDPDNALDINFQLRSLVLQPGTSVILPLTVRIKPERKPEVRPYPFTILVHQGGGGPTSTEIGPPVLGQLLYEPGIEFQPIIERGPSRGPQGDFLIRLVNPSPVSLRLSVRAQDVQQALEFFFGTQVDQITLEPGAPAAIPLLVRLRAPGAPQATYPFQVLVHAVPSDGSSDLDVAVSGEFDYLADEPPLRIDMLPDRARGEMGHFQVRLTSGVGSPLPVILRGRDDTAALQYEFSPPRVQVAPGTVELIDLTVKSRNGIEAFRDYPFDVIAWVPGTGNDGATIHPASWFYVPAPAPAPVPLALQLYPAQVIGPTGQFQVEIENQGTDPLTVILRGSDDAEALEFLYQVPRLQLQPKEATEVSLIVRGRSGVPLPGPYRYPFEVAAWVPGSVTGPGGVQHGELIVVEPPPRPPTWPSGQRLALIAMTLGWIILPFVIIPLARRIPALATVVPLLYTYLPALVLPVIGAVLYGKSPSELSGWRRALIPVLGASALFMFIVPALLPPGATLFGLPASSFVTLILIPALLIMLFA
jgi:hypothetical protein